MKGAYAMWILPSIYVSYHFYDVDKELDIQFNWFNVTAIVSFLSNATYYNNPLLFSKEDYEEYLDKGEKEFLKEKLNKNYDS
jgi:hypothetical protein